jgi:prepilin-type N-terminal cleavage/methylation domain-containing protein
MKNREGFTLVEIVVAMMILSVVMVTLAGLTFTVARRSLAAQGLDQRQAVLLRDVNMMSALPYDSLGNFVGCTSVSTPFAYTRCITMSTPNTNLRRMTVVMTPTVSSLWKPDTMFVDRSKPPVNPLNTQ